MAKKVVHFGNAMQIRIQQHADKIEEVKHDLLRTLGSWWLQARDDVDTGSAQYYVLIRVQEMRKALDAIEQDLQAQLQAEEPMEEKRVFCFPQNSSPNPLTLSRRRDIIYMYQ